MLDTHAAVVERAKQLAVTERYMVGWHEGEDDQRAGHGLIGRWGELEILQDEIRAGDFPFAADSRAGERAGAADEDWVGEGALGDERISTRLRNVVEAMEFDDRSGRNWIRNRDAWSCRRAEGIVDVGRTRPLFDVVMTRNRAGPGIRGRRRRLHDAEARCRNPDRTDPLRVHGSRQKAGTANQKKHSGFARSSHKSLPRKNPSRVAPVDAADAAHLEEAVFVNESLNRTAIIRPAIAQVRRPPAIQV